MSDSLHPNRKGIAMSSNSSCAKRAVLAIALFGGIPCVAHADGSSNSRFGGDGYTYFNEARPVVNKARSEFRQQKTGLPESYYQGLSSPGPEWHPEATIDKSGEKFHQGNPRGVAFSEYQALSSNSSRWQ
jgi:hypothetical protein